MFWVWIAITVAVIIGLSVLAGKSLQRKGDGKAPTRHQQVTALKASGALRHRKSNQP